MAFTQIHPGAKIVGLVDSLMAHDLLNGNDGSAGNSTPNFISLVNADFALPHKAKPNAGRRCRSTGRPARATFTTDLHRQVTLFNQGVSGNHISQLQAAVASRVTAFAPDIILAIGGVNDVNGAFFVWDSVDYTTRLQDTVNQIVAANPSAKIIWTSSLFVGESYTVGAPSLYGPNGGSHDADVEAQSLIIKSIVEAAGGQYIDLRAALIPRSIILNPTNLGNGVLLKAGDGLHTSQLGSRETCAAIKARIVTVP